MFQPQQITREQLSEAVMHVRGLVEKAGVDITTLSSLHPVVVRFVNEIFEEAVQFRCLRPSEPKPVESMVQLLARAFADPDTIVRKLTQDFTWMREVLPTILPAHWSVREDFDGGPNGRGYQRSDGLFVILSGSLEQDGMRWLHLSMSFARKTPSYDDMKECKELFLRNRRAIQIFPPKEEHVNVHNHALHLWANEDDPTMGLPDFTNGLGSI